MGTLLLNRYKKVKHRSIRLIFYSASKDGLLTHKVGDTTMHSLGGQYQAFGQDTSNKLKGYSFEAELDQIAGDTGSRILRYCETKV